MLAFEFCAEVAHHIRALALTLLMHYYCTAIRDRTALEFSCALIISTRKERRKRDRDATEQQERRVLNAAQKQEAEVSVVAVAVAVASQ